MKRAWAILIALTFTLGGQVKMKPDLEKLQGVWTIVSLEMDGKAVPASAIGKARITIEGDRFVSSGMGATYEGKVEIDESATPRTFDVKFDAGPEKGNTSYAIYELDGDTWRLCLTTRGSTRPKKFATEPGTGVALEILKREGVR